MPVINITSKGLQLARITFETLDEVTLESNLSPSSTGDALAASMAQLARSFGEEAATQARSEAVEARANDATAGTISSYLARMFSEMFPGTLECDVDLPDWQASSAN